MNSAEYFYGKEKSESEQLENERKALMGKEPPSVKETTIYEDTADEIFSLVIGSPYLDKKELIPAFTSKLKIFIIDFLKGDCVGTLEKEKIKINQDNNKFHGEKIILEKKLLDAKDELRGGKYVDKKWLADLDFQIKKLGVKIGRNQNRLYEIGLLQKELNRKKSESFDKSFRNAAKEMLPEEKYDEIMESIQQKNDDRQTKIEI